MRCKLCNKAIDIEESGWCFWPMEVDALYAVHMECLDYEVEPVTEDVWSLEGI